MSVTIAEYTRRPQRTYAADGLMDIAIGLSLFGIAFINYAGTQTIAAMHGSNYLATPAYPWANSLSPIAPFAANALIVGSFAAIEPIKRRFVYPRLGYVALRVPRNYQQSKIAIALIAVLLVAGFYRVIDHSLALTPGMSVLGTGILCSGGLAIAFRRLGYVRYLVVAVISLLASVLIASMHRDGLESYGWFTLLMGISMIAAGVTAFARLLRLPILEQSEA